MDTAIEYVGHLDNSSVLCYNIMLDESLGSKRFLRKLQTVVDTFIEATREANKPSMLWDEPIIRFEGKIRKLLPMICEQDLMVDSSTRIANQTWILITGILWWTRLYRISITYQHTYNKLYYEICLGRPDIECVKIAEVWLEPELK